MAGTRRSFGSTLRIGQRWKHKNSGDFLTIKQVYRKDRMVLVEYDDARAVGGKPWGGGCEQKPFYLLKKYYELTTWGAEQIGQ